MTRTPFRILYREFLFRVVDRELLSAGALGDSNRLLGRIAAVLIFFSIPFAGMALGLDSAKMADPRMRALTATAEHALIATTMLIAVLFTALNWNALLPERRDVLVLAHLPVPSRTLFFAKAAAVATLSGLVIGIFNAGPGILLPFAISPAGSSILQWLFAVPFLRTLVCWWITVTAAGSVVPFGALSVQGLIGLLPTRLATRLSSIAQVALLAAGICVYFVSRWPAAPASWFLGLFQLMSGAANDDATRALALRAVIGSALAAIGAAGAFLVAYTHLLRKTVEGTEIAPVREGWIPMPRFGSAERTAVVQFAIRTLFRSRPHRLILAFYAGIGFAVLVMFLRTPFAQQLSAKAGGHADAQIPLPVLVSTFIMMCFWILGVRMAFVVPRELGANWIFRVSPVSGSRDVLESARRALTVIGLAPPWLLCGGLLASLWPLTTSAGHMLVLGLLGMILIELCLHGFHKIPFTCSYLPGRTNLLITLLLCFLLGLNLTFWAAYFERQSLVNGWRYLSMIVLLETAFVVVRWRTETRVGEDPAEVRFEEEEAPVITTLGL